MKIVFTYWKSEWIEIANLEKSNLEPNKLLFSCYFITSYFWNHSELGGGKKPFKQVKWIPSLFESFS